MGHTRQKKLQIEHRRTQVTELCLKRWTQAAIARELGVSQATISYDLKAVHKELKESRVHDLDEAIMREVASLDVVVREAWKEWERSKQPAETAHMIQTNGEKRVEKTVRERSGDYRLLRVMIDASEKRCKLLGLSGAASAAIKPPDEQSDSDRIRNFDWETYYWLTNQDSHGSNGIDDDYIERRLAEEEEKPRSETTGE